MTWLVAGNPLQSVLISRLRYLGDVAMSTVLFEALLAGAPELRLGYLCEQAHGEILVGHPRLHRIHLLGVARSGADARARGHEIGRGETAAATQQVQPQGTLGMVRELRRARYDLAVDLFFNPRSAWLLWLSGIGVRIGGTPKSRRHLYTHTVLGSDIEKLAPDFPDWAPGGLGQHLGRLAPLVHQETGKSFLAWLQDHFEPGDLKPQLAVDTATTDPSYLVLAPGATWPTKEWPAAHWENLIAALVAEGRWQLKILVPPGREEQWGGLAAGYSAAEVLVLPAMGLPAVKNLLGAARGLLSVDGGVMHMGVAVGTATLALFGPTDETIWFPYEAMGPYQVLAEKPDCQPCDLHHCGKFICLPDLAVAKVLAAALDLFVSPRHTQ